MGISSGLSKKINKSAKQFTALLIVLTTAIPQNLFANPTSGDKGETPSTLAPERIDFQKALTSEELAKHGVQPGTVEYFNSTSTIQNQKVDIDVIKGFLPGSHANILVDIMMELEPELRQSIELMPDTKIEFVNTSDPSQKKISVHAQDILDILEKIKSVNKTDYKIPNSLAAEYAELLTNMFKGTVKIFDKTTGQDVFWSFLRVAGSGGITTIGFTVGNIPLPVSAFIGGVVIGGGSGGIGLFLEKFTGWLENNKVTPENTRRYNRIGSVETYMLLSPVLIGLQATGINTIEGAGLIAGTAAASVVIQNVYFFIKKRSPRAAMWYKWYATEALFLSAISYAMPAFGIYSKDVFKTIQNAFVTALMSTSSQGVWDILLTDYIRKPLLQEAIRKDISDLAERISKTPFTEEQFRQIMANRKERYAEENLVRKKFKKYFYFASLASVLSAAAKIVGESNGIPIMETVGNGGLVVLGTSGAVKWASVWFKRDGNQKIHNLLRDMRIATVGLVNKKVAAEQAIYLDQRDIIKKVEKTNAVMCKSLFAN